MSGHCPNCGNTLCICDDIKKSDAVLEEVPNSEWIKTKLKQYYYELSDIECENIYERCVYGEKITKTYKYKRMELQADILRFKISFCESFVRRGDL